VTAFWLQIAHLQPSDHQPVQPSSMFFSRMMAMGGGHAPVVFVWQRYAGDGVSGWARQAASAAARSFVHARCLLAVCCAPCARAPAGADAAHCSAVHAPAQHTQGRTRL
jgi:hypothetical protein